MRRGRLNWQDLLQFRALHEGVDEIRVNDVHGVDFASEVKSSAAISAMGRTASKTDGFANTDELGHHVLPGAHEVVTCLLSNGDDLSRTGLPLASENKSKRSA